MNRWWINELSVREDHDHLVIQTKPNDSVAEVVQTLKVETSRVILEEFPGLEEFLWGDNFWADGYFDEAVGNVDEEVVKQHLRDSCQIIPQLLKPRALAQEVSSFQFAPACTITGTGPVANKPHIVSQNHKKCPMAMESLTKTGKDKR